MDLRELKGLEIAARSRIGFDAGSWVVPSQSGNGTYRVTLDKSGDSGPCDDFQLHLKPCKPIHPARLVRDRDYGGKSPVVADAVPGRPAYEQNWPAYNEAQT